MRRGRGRSGCPVVEEHHLAGEIRGGERGPDTGEPSSDGRCCGGVRRSGQDDGGAARIKARTAWTALGGWAGRRARACCLYEVSKRTLPNSGLSIRHFRSCIRNTHFAWIQASPSPANALAQRERHQRRPVAPPRNRVPSTRGSPSSPRHARSRAERRSALPLATTRTGRRGAAGAGRGGGDARARARATARLPLARVSPEIPAVSPGSWRSPEKCGACAAGRRGQAERVEAAKTSSRAGLGRPRSALQPAAVSASHSQAARRTTAPPPAGRGRIVGPHSARPGSPAPPRGTTAASWQPCRG